MPRPCADGGEHLAAGDRAERADEAPVAPEAPARRRRRWRRSASRSRTRRAVALGRHGEGRRDAHPARLGERAQLVGRGDRAMAAAQPPRREHAAQDDAVGLVGERGQADLAIVSTVGRSSNVRRPSARTRMSAPVTGRSRPLNSRTAAAARSGEAATRVAWALRQSHAAGRRRSSSPAVHEQGELARVGEQHAVAAPHLAVLLEEAAGRRRRAEDGEHRLLGDRRGRRGARKWTVRSMVGAATGRVSRGSGEGHHASAYIASAGASSGCGVGEAQPAAGDRLVGARVERRADRRAHHEVRGRSATSATGAARRSTSSGARRGRRRAGVVQRRRRSRRRRRATASTHSAPVLRQARGHRAQRAPAALDLDVDRAPRPAAGGRR